MKKLSPKFFVIFKVAIWGTIAIFLTLVLVSFATEQSTRGRFGLKYIKDLFSRECEAEIVRKQEVPPDNAQVIKIEWGYGDVSVSPTDGNNFVVVEKAAGKWQKSDLFEITNANGTLSLKQGGSGRNFVTFFNLRKRCLKREISIPRSFKGKVYVKFSSGNFEIAGIEAESLELRMTSGVVKAEALKSGVLLIDMTSGILDMSGAFSEINAKCTSGIMKIQADEAPSKMIFDITSGTASISIPENEGFTLSQSKTSGSLKCEFEVDEFGKYKNGSNQYAIKVTSGSAKLLRKK